MYSIRPIISACMVCGDAAVYYRRGVVCLYVYLLNKMAEPVEMPFGLWTWVGPRNHALVWEPDPPKGSGNVGGHVPIHCKVLAGYTISMWRDWYTVWDEDSGGMRNHAFVAILLQLHFVTCCILLAASSDCWSLLWFLLLQLGENFMERQYTHQLNVHGTYLYVHCQSHDGLMGGVMCARHWPHVSPVNGNDFWNKNNCHF